MRRHQPISKFQSDFSLYSRLAPTDFIQAGPPIVLWSQSVSHVNSPSKVRPSKQTSQQVSARPLLCESRSAASSPVANSATSFRASFQTSKVELEFEASQMKRPQKAATYNTVRCTHQKLRPLTTSMKHSQSLSFKADITELLRCSSIKNLYLPDKATSSSMKGSSPTELPRAFAKKQQDNAKQLREQREKRIERIVARRAQLQRVQSPDLIEAVHMRTATLMPTKISKRKNPSSHKPGLTVPIASVVSAPASPRSRKKSLKLEIPNTRKHEVQALQINSSSQISPWSQTAESLHRL